MPPKSSYIHHLWKGTASAVPQTTAPKERTALPQARVKPQAQRPNRALFPTHAIRHASLTPTAAMRTRYGELQPHARRAGLSLPQLLRDDQHVNAALPLLQEAHRRPRRPNLSRRNQPHQPSLQRRQLPQDHARSARPLRCPHPLSPIPRPSRVHRLPLHQVRYAHHDHPLVVSLRPHKNH